MPLFESLYRGRITALCSSEEVTTCPPFISAPFKARLIEYVAFWVKATHSGPVALKSSAAASLHLYISSAAAIESLCPLLPGFAPRFNIKSYTVLLTDKGFGNVVAALSMYIICACPRSYNLNTSSFYYFYRFFNRVILYY